MDEKFKEWRDEQRAKECARFAALKSPGLPGDAYKNSMESSGYELSEVTKSLIDSYKNNHLQPPSWYSQEEREEFDQNVSDFEQSFKQMGVYIKK